MRRSRMLTLPRRILILCLLIASLVVLSFSHSMRARAAGECYTQWGVCMDACPNDPDLTLEGCHEKCDTNLHYCLLYND